MTLRERLATLGRSRAGRTVLRVALVLLALRALLAFAQPFALAAAARALQLECEYEDLELSLLSGEVRLRRLVLREPAAEAPALELDFLAADLAWFETLRGTPTVERVELDGLRTRLAIDAQGRLDWLERLGSSGPAPESEPEDTEPKALDLRLPLVVREVRATRIELRCSDQSVSPALEVELTLDAAASNVGADARFELWATSPQLLDTLRVEGRAASGLRSASLELDWRAEGLRPSPLASHLAALGIEATAARIDARGSLSAGLQPATHDEVSCSGGLAVRAIDVTADGQSIASLSELAVALRSLGNGRVELASVRVAQPRVQVVRDARGRIGVPGFAWLGAPAPAAPAQTSAPAPIRARNSPVSLALDLLTIEGARASLRDLEERAPELEVELDGELLSFEWPPAKGANAEYSFHLRAPGVVEDVTCGGNILNEDDRAALSVGYRAEGLTLGKLAPWIEPLGLTPELAQGRSEGVVSVRVALESDGPQLDVSVRDLTLSDGATLASLKSLELRGLDREPDGVLTLEALEIAGPRALVRRDSEGALHVLGLRIATATAPGPAEPATPRAAPTLAIPALRLGKIDLHDAELTLVDEGHSPSVDHRVRDVTFRLDSLDTVATESSPARFACSFAADGVLEEGSLAGTLLAQRTPAALELDASLQLRTIDLRPLESYLATLGLAPALGAGRVSAKLGLSARGESMRIAAHAEELRLEDGTRELAAVDSLRIEGFELGSARPEIAALVVRGARVGIERDADGGLRACGLRVVPAAPPAPESEPTPAPTTNPTPLRLSLPALELGELRIDAARVAWNDAASSPARAAELVLDARLVGLASDAPTPAQLDVRASVPDVVDELHLFGELALSTGDASALELGARLEARGLRAGPLAPYLPAGLECTLASGSADAQMRLRAAAHPAGGLSASALLEQVSFRDGERSLAALGRASIDVERVDPLARVIALREVAVEGIDFALARTSNGTVETLGMRIVPMAAPELPTPEVAAQARRLPAYFGPLPSVSIGRLALELARLEVRDESCGPGAKPLVLSASLGHREPLTLLAPQAEKLPPLQFTARASVADLCDALECDVTLAPWASSPSLELALCVRGLHGEPLLEHLPALAGKLHARELQSGEFDLHLAGEFNVARRGPLGIDWASGIKGRIELDRCEFRAQSGGEVVAGLQRARAEIARLDPQRGEYQLKSLELSTPRLRALRDTEGLHVLGLVVPLPQPSASASTSASTSAPAPALAPTQPAATAVDTDFAIARLDLDGIDVELVDRTGPEPVVVPLKNLDLELRKFSTRSLARGGSVQFQAVLEPGPVSLPRRVRSTSLVGGLAKATAAALKGAKESAEREERPLFSSITLAGRVAPLPAPTGWVTLDISEFELTGVRGLASQQGVEIGDGVLDLAVRARLGGASGLSVQATTSLAHVRLSEPPNGPISRYLALPAPLDTVLFLLEDAEGRQRIPVSLRVGPDGAHPAQLATAAASAAAVVIARAVASSPLRVLGTFTDVLGLTGNPAPKPGDFARSFDFDPGDGVGAADGDALDALARRLAADTSLQVTLFHEFGAADLSRAERLASPGADDCRALVARARERRAALSRRREEIAAEARIETALGRETEAGELRARVRAIDVELGLAEAALDRLLELLLPGSERRAPQRTRAAALAIASERLERIRQSLLERGIAPTRIELRPARSLDPSREQGGRVTALPRRKS